MRITVDIDEDTLKDLVSISGESKKSPAIKLAVKEYVQRAKCKEFGRLIMEGAFTKMSSNQITIPINSAIDGHSRFLCLD